MRKIFALLMLMLLGLPAASAVDFVAGTTYYIDGSDNNANLLVAGAVIKVQTDHEELVCKRVTSTLLSFTPTENSSKITIKRYNPDCTQVWNTISNVSASTSPNPEMFKVNGQYLNSGGWIAFDLGVTKGEFANSEKLPRIYISVTNEDGSYDDVYMSRNLGDKDYRAGSYYMVNADGTNIPDLGTKEAPLPLEIKARGNYTRTGFAKKPFKLKLGKKKVMFEGATNSKHYALLAHADDNKGYLKNYVGFWLGHQIFPEDVFTPHEYPVELYLNDTYWGLYFLTESIRVGDDRIKIEELKDEETDPALISGGYLVELDNYADGDQQIKMTDASNGKELLITPDTPEIYSDIQRKFVTEQFTNMNKLVGSKSDDLWKYMDLDMAARYYVVMEILGHWEAYHGSTYLYRDRGENQKWMFSPLWDCGHALEFSQGWITNIGDPVNYGNTWIGNMKQNAQFMNKVKATYKWFWGNKVDNLYDDMEAYVKAIEVAAQKDHLRWKDEPKPHKYNDPLNNYNVNNPTDVIDNSNLVSNFSTYKNVLENRIKWLNQSGQWGVTPAKGDPEPDWNTIESVPLPDYAKEGFEPDPEPDPNAVVVPEDVAGNGVYPVFLKARLTEPKMYAYIYGNNNEPNGGWAGKECELVTINGQDYWYIVVNAGYDSDNWCIIFNNQGDGGNNNWKAADGIKLEKRRVYDTDGKATTEKIAAGTYGSSDPNPNPGPDEPDSPADAPENMYIVGTIDGHNWDVNTPPALTKNGGVYTISDVTLTGSGYFSFITTSTTKTDNSKWNDINAKTRIGAPSGDGKSDVKVEVKDGILVITKDKIAVGAGDKKAFYLGNSGTYNFTVTWVSASDVTIKVSTPDYVDPTNPDNPDDPDRADSGELPRLYITAPEAVEDRNLADKDYRDGKYYLVDKDGNALVGSEEAPLDMEIKARGNYTRTGFSKKPFKLKLGKAQELLGMTKSKHYAILAHADDDKGYLKNYVGFWLGQQIFPNGEEVDGVKRDDVFTPHEEPIEVYINGKYWGLYFLTESIRIGDDRIKIEELGDNVWDPALVSGGYLVELDNYDEGGQQIKMTDATNNRDLIITPDTPEIYSDLQKKFVTNQFSTMNTLAGQHSDDLWKYMDLDMAARYYVVMEIIGHYEAYHGSTYLYRDRGEGKKWMFSPLWDCGHALEHETGWITNVGHPIYGNFGNNWINGFKQNTQFMNKVKDTYAWFMGNKVDNLYTDMESYVKKIEKAAKKDHARWGNEPKPNAANGNDPSDVADNSNLVSKFTNEYKPLLEKRINWLNQQWNVNPSTSCAEPAWNTIESAPLPDYAKEGYDVTIPDAWIVAKNTNNWSNKDSDKGDAKFTFDLKKSTYSITIADSKLRAEGEENGFKLAYNKTDNNWANIWGVAYGDTDPIENGKKKAVVMAGDSKNLILPDDAKGDITIVFDTAGKTVKISWTEQEPNPEPEYPWGSTNDPDMEISQTSGNLPVLYIMSEEDFNLDTLDGSDESKKKKISSYYWLDPKTSGVEAIGSKTEPKQLTMKGRGNWTWKGYDKKPFKITFSEAQEPCGMKSAKAFGLLAAADDNKAYLRNTVGFKLAKELGLPWTPDQYPVEVIFNGKYRGMYMLTDLIEIGENRVNITPWSKTNKLDENGQPITDADGKNVKIGVEGGTIVEIDNYDDANQIRIFDNHLNKEGQYEPLRFTYDKSVEDDLTPAGYEDKLTAEFNTINQLIGQKSADVWNYIDIDDAARFILVQEMMGNYESFHGSCYLHKDLGEGQKWHFSPVWDFGSSFNRFDQEHFYKPDPKDDEHFNHWVADLVQIEGMTEKLTEHLATLTNAKMTELNSFIDAFISQIAQGAAKDKARWPQYGSDNFSQEVSNVKEFLSKKRTWLQGQYPTEVEEPETPDAWIISGETGWKENEKSSMLFIYDSVNKVYTLTIEPSHLKQGFKIGFGVNATRWENYYGPVAAKDEPNVVLAKGVSVNTQKGGETTNFTIADNVTENVTLTFDQVHNTLTASWLGNEPIEPEVNVPDAWIISGQVDGGWQGNQVGSVKFRYIKRAKVYVLDIAKNKINGDGFKIGYKETGWGNVYGSVSNDNMVKDVEKALDKNTNNIKLPNDAPDNVTLIFDAENETLVVTWKTGNETKYTHNLIFIDRHSQKWENVSAYVLSPLEELGAWPGTLMAKKQQQAPAAGPARVQSGDVVWTHSFESTVPAEQLTVYYNNNKVDNTAENEETAEQSLLAENNAHVRTDNGIETELYTPIVSGIEAAGANGYSISVMNGMLVVNSDVEMLLPVVTIDGRVMIIEITPGITMIGLDHGVYIVDGRKFAL